MSVFSCCFGFVRRCHGTSAVEFALVAPIFLLLVCGTLAFGLLFATVNSVQQLAAEAARASVAGLDGVERDQLARAYVGRSATAYGVLDPVKLTVSTNALASTFQVTVAYDMSASPIYGLARIVPMPSPLLRRSAIVQNGGY